VNKNYLYLTISACKETKIMRKEMYIIRGGKESYPDFTRRILDLSQKTSSVRNLAGLGLTVTTAPPPLISVIPFRRKKIAVISLHRESDEPVSNLLQAEGFSGAYLVEEALPVSHEVTWEKGQASPGPCLLTLFHRKPGVDETTFIDRWHNSHTPLSLKLHPLWHYNRNVILSRIGNHGFWYDGIVEEMTRTRSELLNPFKFFGRPHRVVGNMIAVYRDTNSFLDYKTIETYLTQEFLII
jgi:hypothetical protein